MKDILIATIITAFIGLGMVGIALWVVNERCDAAARIAAEQANFDYYYFIMPDGAWFMPADFMEE